MRSAHGLAAGYLGAHFQFRPDRPEAEEPDAVLALKEQLAALLGRQAPLA